MELIDEFPEGWGQDRLSDFQHHAFANELLSYANDKVFTKLLTDCDSLIFESLLKAWPEQTDETNLGAILFVNSHNHFRASARLCLSGQCLPAYPTARACLETAVYAWFLITLPENIKVWLNKPKSKCPEFYRWNDTFKFSNIAKRIGQLDPEMEEMLNHLHQMAIDFGAHPNKNGLFSNMSPYPENKAAHRIAYMHSDGVLLHYTFNFMFDIALSMLVLIKLAYKSLETDVEFTIKADALLNRALEQRRLFKLNWLTEDK
jgi:hypothetical protein